MEQVEPSSCGGREAVVEEGCSDQRIGRESRLRAAAGDAPKTRASSASQARRAGRAAASGFCAALPATGAAMIST